MVHTLRGRSGGHCQCFLHNEGSLACSLELPFYPGKMTLAVGTLVWSEKGWMSAGDEEDGVNAEEGGGMNAMGGGRRPHAGVVGRSNEVPRHHRQEGKDPGGCALIAVWDVFLVFVMGKQQGSLHVLLGFLFSYSSVSFKIWFDDQTVSFPFTSLVAFLCYGSSPFDQVQLVVPGHHFELAFEVSDPCGKRKIAIDNLRSKSLQSDRTMY